MEQVTSLPALGLSYKQVEHFAFRLSTRRVVNAAAIGAADAVMLGAAIIGSPEIRDYISGGVNAPFKACALIVAWWLGAWLVGLSPGWGLSTVEHLRRQVVLVTVFFAGLAALAGARETSQQITASAFILAWAIAITLVPIGRTFVRHILCLYKWFGMPTIIYGHAAVAAELIASLRAELGLGYLPTGVCTDDGAAFVAGVPVVGPLGQVNPMAPAAIVASRGMTREETDALISRVLRTYSSVLILPDVSNVPSLFVLSRDLGGAVGLEFSQALLSPFARMLKRVVDLLLVALTAPIWMPVMGSIYVAIWLHDRRNPIFLQQRSGRKGRSFYTIKFRTMVPQAENVLKQRLEKDDALRAEWDANCKLRNDPRITSVGHFLRRTSLDELPQLFNVIRGEMALVGPRPLPVYHLNALPEPVREIRHQVRPGLTGLWQVSGRSDAGNAGMARWDPYYVRNWSMWLDIVILVRTVRVVLRGSGAR